MPPVTTLKRRHLKNPHWQEVDDLAYDYYQDQTDLRKRDALYECLTKQRYEDVDQINPETDKRELVPVAVGSYLQNLARTVVINNRKAWLGASVTVVSQDVLQDVMVKTDKEDDLPFCRPTALFGNALKGVEGRYDPARAAFHTWFSKILYNAFNDLARKYNSRRKKEGLIESSGDAEDGDTASFDAQELTLEALDHWCLIDYDANLRSKYDQVLAQFADADALLREVALSVALAVWTGETEADIQQRLGITRDELRGRKEKALARLRPLLESWLDES